MARNTYGNGSNSSERAKPSKNMKAESGKVRRESSGKSNKKKEKGNERNNELYSKGHGKSTIAKEVANTVNFPLLFRGVLFLLLLTAVFYPAFLRGLYFETEQLQAEIFIFILFGAYWAYKLIKRDKLFLATSLDYASFGFVIVYGISLFVAVSLRLAVSEWLKYCMYFSIFFMVSDMSEKPGHKKAILWTIIASVTGISVLGIDGVAGNHISTFFNTMFNNDHLFFGLVTEDNRICSTLQYPNALASLVLGVFFIVMGVILTTESWKERAIASACGNILLTVFIFTISRGAYVFLPLAALFLVAALPQKTRLKALSYLIMFAVFMGLTVLSIYGLISDTAGRNMLIWVYVLLFSTACSLSSAVLHIVINWLSGHWKVLLAIAGSVLIVFAGLCIYALNVPSPLILDASASNVPVIKLKRVVLKSGTENTLVVNMRAEAHKADDKPSNAEITPYYITILSQSEKDILVSKETQLLCFYGRLTDGTETVEIPFSVPKDSKKITIGISTQPNFKTEIESAKIITPDNKDGMPLILNYKYLPDSIASRLEDFKASQSALVRRIYYRDAFKIIRDYWLLGAGGGAWSLLYLSYQSYSYFTSQAHNYFLQLFIETGIMGIIIFAFLLFSILVLFLQDRLRKQKHEATESLIVNVKDADNELNMKTSLLTAIMVLFGHSFMDFDLSLPGLCILLWAMIGAFNSYYRFDEERKRVTQLCCNWLNRFRAVLIPQVIPVVIMLVLVVIPVRFTLARTNAQNAIKAVNENDMDAGMNYLKKAYELDPINPVYKMDYINLLLSKPQATQAEYSNAARLIKDVEKHTKFNYFTETVPKMELLPFIAQYYFSTGNVDKGLSFLDRNLELEPLNPLIWEQKASGFRAVILDLFDRGKNEEALKYIDLSLEMIDLAKKINKKNMDPFVFTENTQLILERMKYIRDNKDKGMTINYDKILFNSMPEMDVNEDGVPDQWTAIGSSIQVATDNDIISVKNTDPSQMCYFRSRLLTLQPGKTYQISMQAEAEGLQNIDFIITNPNIAGKMILENGIYTAEVNMPPYNADFPSYFQIPITNTNIKIKNLTIIEK